MKTNNVRCANCESEFQEGYEFCPHCGQKAKDDLTKQAAKLLDQKPEKKAEPDPRLEKLQAIWAEFDKLAKDSDEYSRTKYYGTKDPDNLCR